MELSLSKTATFVPFSIRNFAWRFMSYFFPILIIVANEKNQQVGLVIRDVESMCQWLVQDFPDGGGCQPQGGDANLLFGQLFPKNCMKMKEISHRGARVTGAPLDPPICVLKICTKQPPPLSIVREITTNRRSFYFGFQTNSVCWTILFQIAADEIRWTPHSLATHN